MPVTLHFRSNKERTMREAPATQTKNRIRRLRRRRRDLGFGQIEAALPPRLRRYARFALWQLREQHGEMKGLGRGLGYRFI